MDTSLDEQKLESNLTFYPDRQKKLRIICDSPDIAEGIDEDRNKFHEDARLVNLSGNGLFMKVHRLIKNGSHISITIYLISGMINKDTPRITTIGIVTPCEPQADGSSWIAVRFTSYQFQ